MDMDMFEKIRKGDEAVAKKICRNLQNTALRGAVVAIVSRNNSHGIGEVIKNTSYSQK